MSQGTNTAMEASGPAETEVAPTDPDFIVYLLDPLQEYNCYFVVGNPDLGNTERIGVVKKMLLAHSLVLRAELQDSKIAEKSDVKVTDIFPRTFKNLLRFVYGYDNTEGLSFDEADNLLYAAEKYMMPKLKNKLATLLMSMLDCSNICSLMNNPACYTVLELNSAITEILQLETDQVLASPQFLDLSPLGFLKLVEQEVSNVTEIELWRAAIKWAKNRTDVPAGRAAVAGRDAARALLLPPAAGSRHRRLLPQLHCRGRGRRRRLLFRPDGRSSPWQPGVADQRGSYAARRHTAAQPVQPGESENVQDLRTELNDHLQHIRICSMSDEDILAEVILTRVLTYDELILVGESRRTGEVQPRLTTICNVIEERERPLVKSELLRQSLIGNSFQYTNRIIESTFKLKTKDAAIELCSVQLYYTGMSAHQCNCTISIQRDTEPPIVARFEGQVNQASEWVIPIHVDDKNVQLSPNSSYSMRFTFSCSSTHCGRRKLSSPYNVSGNHFSVDFQVHSSGYYMFQVNEIRYKALTKRVKSVQAVQ